MDEAPHPHASMPHPPKHVQDVAMLAGVARLVQIAGDLLQQQAALVEELKGLRADLACVRQAKEQAEPAGRRRGGRP